MLRVVSSAWVLMVSGAPISAYATQLPLAMDSLRSAAISPLKPVSVYRPVGVQTICGQTTRLVQPPTLRRVTRVGLLVSGTGGPSASDRAGANAVFVAGSVEYPLNDPAYSPIRWNGQALGMIEGSRAVDPSDETATDIPAGAAWAIRYFAEVACPPADPAASVGAEGSLTPGTPYYYAVTATLAAGGARQESGPSAEVRVVPSRANRSAALGWRANASPAQAASLVGYTLYRGVAPGQERLLARLSGRTMSFLDRGGATDPDVAAPPPRVAFYGVLASKDQTSTNAGVNATLSGGGDDVFANSGPALSRAPFPLAVLVDDPAGRSVIGEGDSQMSGAGIPFLGYASRGSYQSNWFDLGLRAAGVHGVNVAVSGSQLRQLMSARSGAPSAARLALARYADVVLNQLAINDLGAGQGWRRTALRQLDLARRMIRSGRRYYLATTQINTTTSDNGLTIGGQTPEPSEADRKTYNRWVRNGARTLAGAPVLAGGAPSPLFKGFYDLAAPVECDRGNVRTLNGGYWCVPSSPLAHYTVAGAATVLGRYTTLPISGAPRPHTLQGQVIAMTSGPADGQVAIVYDNSDTTLTLINDGVGLSGTRAAGLRAAPSSGDRLSSYDVLSDDAHHLSLSGNALVGRDFQLWLRDNIVGEAVRAPGPSRP